MIQKIIDLANQGGTDGWEESPRDGETTDDGQGGTFKWVADDIQDGDDIGFAANIIKVTGQATGSWIRQPDPTDAIESDIQGLKTQIAASGSSATAIKNAVNKAIAPILNNTPQLFNGYAYFTPVTGATITLLINTINVINPAGTISNLTIIMPASPQDGDSVLIKWVQAVTTVTYGTPSLLVNASTTPSAKGNTTYTWRSALNKWL